MKIAIIVWVVLIVAVGIGVFVTASQSLAIVWGVLILLAGLTVTGVLTELWLLITGKK